MLHRPVFPVFQQVRRGGELAQTLVAIRAAAFAKGKKRKASAQAQNRPSWPQKFRRRLHGKQGMAWAKVAVVLRTFWHFGHTNNPSFWPDFRPLGAHNLWKIKGINCLHSNLMATIFSFTDVSTKLSAMGVSHGLWKILQCSSAWDPVVVNQAVCCQMLRSLRASAFANSKKLQRFRIPKALYSTVSFMDIHLMDAERTVREQSDTEDDERRPLAMTIVSPMRELSRGGGLNVCWRGASQRLVC